MIKVLQNWQEIDTATTKLRQQGLPLHLDIHKNWDHFLLYDLICHKEKQTCIYDLGCGECCTLNFLTALGYRNLHGIDLKLKQNSDTPYTLYQGDLTKT